MSKEVMQMALDALKNHSGNYKLNKEETKKQIAVEMALEEALAQKQCNPIRGLVKELMRQIEIGDFVDGHGHSAKMLDAVHKLNKELQND